MLCEMSFNQNVQMALLWFIYVSKWPKTGEADGWKMRIFNFSGGMDSS